MRQQTQMESLKKAVEIATTDLEDSRKAYDDKNFEKDVETLGIQKAEDQKEIDSLRESIEVREKNAEEESRIKVLLDNLEMKRLDLQKELEAILKVTMFCDLHPPVLPFSAPLSPGPVLFVPDRPLLKVGSPSFASRIPQSTAQVDRHSTPRVCVRPWGSWKPMAKIWIAKYRIKPERKRRSTRNV